MRPPNGVSGIREVDAVRVKPGVVSRKEKEFFENIGSLEDGREIVFRNSKHNAQTFWYATKVGNLLIFYNEEFDPGSG